ncbi:hypothetical protein A7U60_g8894 [Sanghuangporus baumii]|uniref:ATPase inhibitor, mitochondrial n=1 Tax=Sanghuangporus baumii TaxID=108892 RepID=A0A9Q5HR09_SANBA|nr:hypothetical protein A7U60_g8894 [Sanghuangporus baumii]
MSWTTAQDNTWKAKEQGEEAQYARQKEQEQLAALRAQMNSDAKEAASRIDKDIEGGFGGQEDLEDRYATTSGEH